MNRIRPAFAVFLAPILLVLFLFLDGCSEQEQLAMEKTNTQECFDYCRKAGATGVAICHGRCLPCICIYPMPPAPVSPTCQTP